MKVFGNILTSHLNVLPKCKNFSWEWSWAHHVWGADLRIHRAQLQLGLARTTEMLRKAHSDLAKTEQRMQVPVSMDSSWNKALKSQGSENTLVIYTWIHLNLILAFTRPRHFFPFRINFGRRSLGRPNFGNLFFFFLFGVINSWH